MQTSSSVPLIKPTESGKTTELVVRAALLLLAVLAGSTAVIMIKASTEHPLLVASYRLLVAAVVLSPFFVRDLRAARRQSPPAYTLRQLGWSALPALALAAHFATWVVGARLTPVSNASLFVNISPLALPFFLWLFYRERITRIETIGTLFALAGVLILSGSHYRLDAQTFLGDMICLGSMLAFAAYIALGRKNGGRLSLWLYMVPLYAMAGLLCLAAALPFINPIKAYSLPNILYIVGLGVIPTIIGHTLLNYSLQYFRGQVVGIANLGQIVFAGVMAFFIFGEIPSLLYYFAAALIVAGIVIGISGQRKR